MIETLQTQLYWLEHFANTLVSEQLTSSHASECGHHFSCWTADEPYALYAVDAAVDDRLHWRLRNPNTGAGGEYRSTWFALGLATTLAGLGIVAAVVGKIYGQIGLGLPIVVSAIAILMGLNLLEALPLRLPSFGGLEWISKDLPSGVRSYLIGLTFGLSRVSMQHSRFSKHPGVDLRNERSRLGQCAAAVLYRWLCGSARAGRDVHSLYQKVTGTPSLVGLDHACKRRTLSRIRCVLSAD